MVCRKYQLFYKNNLVIQSYFATLNGMDLENAMNQLSDIRNHLFKAEVFHGFKAIPLALSGAGALLAAFVQPLWVPKGWAVGYVMYWSVIAILALMVFAGSLFYNYYRNNEVERRVTRQIILQFSPSVFIGGLLTVLACFYSGQLPYFMPGLWCIILALGIFSSRPYLPPNIMFVGGYYVAAGCVLFLTNNTSFCLSPWNMGLAFAIGQMLAAITFYFDLERKDGA